MKYRKVTESEKRKILLGMLKEIDEFCRLNGIRYSLAFGTALGAVRHHGFIPWDDDVDIIMPLPDMLFFKEIFRSEKLLYHDIDTNPEHAFHFSRVSYAPTFNKEGLIATSYGVNIDLYPVVGLPRSKDEFERFFLEACRYNKKKANIVKWRGRIVRRLPIKTIPGYTRMVRKERNFILFSYPYDLSSSFLHAGSLRMVNVIGFDVFEHLIDVDFEGLKLLIPARYDEYLSHCFGDYMKLPPEEERHPYHGGCYYWKKKN